MGIGLARRYALGAVLLLAAPRLSAQHYQPLTEAEALQAPTAARLAGFAGYAHQAGWSKLTPMFRAAARQAYEKGKLPAAERWYQVYRWSQLFAETEVEFIPKWMKVMEDSRLVHANLPHRYVPHQPQLGDWLSPALQLWLLGNGDFSGEFFAVLSPADFLPDVLHILNELHQRDPARFAEYAHLALAIAVVYDLPPPPDWPHGQIPPEAFLRQLPGPTEAFDWWVQQDQHGHTYFRLTSLGADELKFVVDAAAPYAELSWTQRNIDLPLSRLDRAYPMIRYRNDRVAKELFIWPDGPYTLANILHSGGICIDQAYFASEVGKARGVPTLLFRGEGKDGRHAWFGYLDDNRQWQLNAGRLGEQRLVTGYARDPQTWGEISDHELQFLSERFRNTPNFHTSRVHQALADDYLQSGDTAAAIRAAWKALNFERRNLDAWATLLDAQAKQGDTPKQVEATLYQAIAAYGRYPDLEAAFSGRLCRSLRARGQLSAADYEEQRILDKNRIARSDLELLRARDNLAETLATKPLADCTKAYDKLVDTLGRGAGIDFYDRIVTPFVQYLQQQGKVAEARTAAERARAVMYAPPNSQLAGEFDQLFKELKTAVPAGP